jgi:hypothetical protein
MSKPDKHERKRDAYPGGSTVISDRNKTWFSKKSTKVPPNSAGKPPRRSREEQKAFEEFANKQDPPKLLKRSYLEKGLRTSRQIERDRGKDRP